MALSSDVEERKEVFKKTSRKKEVSSTVAAAYRIRILEGNKARAQTYHKTLYTGFKLTQQNEGC